MNAWKLPIADGPPLTANTRLHHMERAARVKVWREAAYYAVLEAKMPKLDRIRVRLYGTPPTNRRRDPSNWMPTQKAIIDGIVLAGVVPGDDPAHVVEDIPVMRDANPAVPWWRWTLEIGEA